MNWIAVDLDGTLAECDGRVNLARIGKPVASMVERVKRWRAEGKCVKIFTARMTDHGLHDLNGGRVDALTPIRDWCREHLGEALPVTNVKDFGMVELWDDRCVQVVPNTGIRASANPHSVNELTTP